MKLSDKKLNNFIFQISFDKLSFPNLLNIITKGGRGMNVTDMISQTSELITAIKKCQSLYHYCNDNHLIYRYIIKEIYRINKVDVLLVFLADDLRENCSLEDLKHELLKLYRVLSDEFLLTVKNYNHTKEVAY